MTRGMGVVAPGDSVVSKQPSASAARPYWSAAGPAWPVWYSSGATYCTSREPVASARATAKSPSSANPSDATMTFAGLMFPCVMPRRWA